MRVAVVQFDITTISSKIREGEYAIHPHADKRMRQRNITVDSFKKAIGNDSPKIIERYEFSCLVLGWASVSEPIHAVISFGTVKKEYDLPLLVTVYRPDKQAWRWKDQYATRKKKQV